MVRRRVAPTEQFGDGYRLKALFQQFLRQVFHHGAGVQALAVGMEDDDAAAVHPCSQVLEHPVGRQARIGVPRDSTPENELQTERLCNLHSGVIVFAVRRPEQQPAIAIPLLEREDRPADLGALVVRVQRRQVGVDLPVRSDLKEGDGQERLDLGLMFDDPPAGQKKRGRNAALHEHINQGSVVPGVLAHRTHVKGQRHGLATRRAGSDYLSRAVSGWHGGAHKERANSKRSLQRHGFFSGAALGGCSTLRMLTSNVRSLPARGWLVSITTESPLISSTLADWPVADRNIAPTFASGGTFFFGTVMILALS